MITGMILVMHSPELAGAVRNRQPRAVPLQ